MTRTRMRGTVHVPAHTIHSDQPIESESEGGVKETGTARQSARSLVREQEKGGRREGGGAGGGDGEMKRGVNHGHQGEGAV